jgi:dCMP deaminase
MGQRAYYCIYCGERHYTGNPTGPCRNSLGGVHRWNEITSLGGQAQEAPKERKDQTALNWDQHYISLLEPWARKSKDPSTKVGCILTIEDRVLSMGFNGFPRRVGDDPRRHPERYEGNARYDWTIHAEPNAICNAAKHGIALNGATAYISLPPCGPCAGLLVQAGIWRVVYDQKFTDEWRARRQSKYIDNTLALTILEEGRVKIEGI